MPLLSLEDIYSSYFDLAMHYVNQIPKYGVKSDQLKLTKRKTKKPHFRGLIDEILVVSGVAGEGFEPPTFGL